MKRSYKLEGLDCASCAAKIENAVCRLEGVSAASVNFLTAKMVLEGDEARLDAIETQALKIVKKAEPDVKIKRV